MDGPLIAIIAMDTARNVEFVSPSCGHVKGFQEGIHAALVFHCCPRRCQQMGMKDYFDERILKIQIVLPVYS